ncbi:MAG: hypothetical protein U7123_22130 [Potamolinea sp.]
MEENITHYRLPIPHYPRYLPLKPAAAYPENAIAHFGVKVEKL